VDAEAAITRVERAKARGGDIAARLAHLAPDVALQRAALQVLGRTGAQRVVAEAALAQVAEDGNAALVEAGIDLSFRVEWSRETKQPAAECDQCGALYPRRERCRKCERCGAPRGRRLSDELRLEPSRRSGGADDLVGVAFKLAAGAWLRRWRKTCWSIMLIDEPFGSLDRANVRRLAQHLGGLLGRRFGAAQSFIVAHHADVLEAMPGRLHVQQSGDGRKIERCA
jgi:hypothetical protein